MNRIVNENEWGQIRQHDSAPVLELTWRTGVAMTDAAFKATLCALATMAERTAPSGILIDAREFRHQFGAGIMAWRDQAIAPRYGAAGVRKFAFVLPAGAPLIGTESRDESAVYPTAWFGSREDALAWLTA